MTGIIAYFSVHFTLPFSFAFLSHWPDFSTVSISNQPQTRSSVPQSCAVLVPLEKQSVLRSEPARSCQGWQLKGTSGTKRSRRSDVGTLTLGRDPLPPSPLFEKEREAGPLSKKALKHVLDLKTCEKSLYCLHPFLRFSVTWMCI